MDLKIACYNILDQMSETIDRIDDTEFVKPSITLNGSTLGQHFRHAIEFFECLSGGYSAGVICYDNRDHDKKIEENRVLAQEVINRVKDFVLSSSLNRQLSLVLSYNPEYDERIEIDTNMARELVYNIEHVVHHMALVKIGLREIVPELVMPADFGVAVSTIKYQKSQA